MRRRTCPFLPLPGLARKCPDAAFYRKDDQTRSSHRTAVLMRPIPAITAAPPTSPPRTAPHRQALGLAAGQPQPDCRQPSSRRLVAALLLAAQHCSGGERKGRRGVGALATEMRVQQVRAGKHGARPQPAQASLIIPPHTWHHRLVLAVVVAPVARALQQVVGWGEAPWRGRREAGGGVPASGGARGHIRGSGPSSAPAGAAAPSWRPPRRRHPAWTPRPALQQGEGRTQGGSAR